MTPHEQQLIQEVANRLRNAKLPETDAEAEAFITAQISAQPNSAYLLTQAVILQEHALKQAQEQIESLQEQVKQARQAGSRSSQPPAGTSFLGGLFGGGRQQATPSALHSPSRPVRNDPWGGPGASPQAGAGGGFGSFMRSAAAVAAGVAGGYLLSSALQDMLGGEETGAEQLAEDNVTPDTAAMLDEPVANAEEVGNQFEESEHVDSGGDDFDADFGGDGLDDDDWA